MTPEQIEKIIGRDDRDTLIDEWASRDHSIPGGETLAPGQVSLTFRNYDWCLAFIDMAQEILEFQKGEFVAAEYTKRSSDAIWAAYKVVAARELLRQLIPLRNQVIPYPDV